MTQESITAGESVGEETSGRNREQPGPVSRWEFEGSRWLVTGHEAVCAAAKNPGTFSSRHDLPNGSSPYLGVMVPATPIRGVPTEIDAPLHQEYRKILNSQFSPTVVRAMAPRILEFTDWCIDQWVGTGEADLFHGLAKLVPTMTVLDLLGLPVADAAIVADAANLSGDDRFEPNKAFELLFARITETIAARREKPEDDLLSRLVTAEIEGRPFTDMELVELSFTMVIAGVSSTARLVLGTLSYLGAHPDRRTVLIEDPSRLATAMEEFLRFYSPAPFQSRTATEDVCFYGQDIKAGEWVALSWAAANRDPEVFEDPTQIVLDRTPNRHLALGHGIHFCLGGGLGKAEALTMVERVLSRIPDYRVREENRPADGDGGLDGAIDWEARISRALPVSFTPGTPVGTASFRLNSLF
ncbi:cytochrome P450 [Kitasatospora sp. NBC_00315]|uniref:cytochrome P450 n=1 Tax=Kitasatospora sp. NBC_00315 TaxID=2975963 RepID=UPI00324F9FBC